MKKKQQLKTNTVRLALSISWFLCPTIVHAQADLSEDLFFEDIPIVLTASRIQQPLSNVPAAITVIDQEMIEASGAVKIVDLLRLAPGFQVGYVSGHKFTATYHGNTDQYARDLQVLIDGRSVYDPAFGGVAWSDLPLAMEDILRIEVIRGPNAAAYGSNSFSGVINFITRHPATQQGVSTYLTVGEGGTRKLMARYGGSYGDLTYRLSASYDENDGFSTRRDSSRTHWINFRGDTPLSNTDTLQIQFGYSDGAREDGFFNDTLQPFREVGDTYHFQQMRWTRTISPENEYSLQVYHNYLRVKDDFDIDITLLPFFINAPYHGGLGFESDRLDIEFQANISNDDNWKLAWGLGARQDSVKSIWVLNSDNAISRDQVRAFINAERRFSDLWTLNLGGMVERFQGQSELYSPRIAINWHADHQNTIRLAVSQAYRMPTLVEQHANQFLFSQSALPNLQTYQTIDHLLPEKIQSYEIGYLGLFMGNSLTIDAKLFHEEKSDILTSYPDQTNALNVRRFGNGGELEINGIEWGLKWRPNAQSLLHIAYSLARANGVMLNKIDAGGGITYGKLDASVPEQSISLLGSHRFSNGYQISSAFYYADIIDYSGEGDFIPCALRWDLKLSKSFMLDNTEGNISLILQDIDGGDADFYNSPADFKVNRRETRAFLQIDLTWP